MDPIYLDRDDPPATTWTARWLGLAESGASPGAALDRMLEHAPVQRPEARDGRLDGLAAVLRVAVPGPLPVVPGPARIGFAWDDRAAPAGSLGASLRIRGAWATETAQPGPWLAGQDRCSLSFFYRPNAPAVPDAWILVSNTKLVAIYGDPAPGAVRMRLWGNTQPLDASFPAVPGRTYHVALSWDGAGVSHWYVDGQAVASARALGPTWNAPGRWMIGPGDATADYQLQDLAVWHGYALSPGDAAGLATGASTPATVLPPATAWWPLGRRLAVDPSADRGFADAMGGVGAFGAPVGPGSCTYAEALADGNGG